MAIALSCDLRFAAEGSTFDIPAAKLGVGYGAQGIGVLQALVGPAYTREILYTGRRFDGDEALRMGLINHLMSREELEPYVRDYADTIGHNAPLTLKAAKLASSELLKDEEDRDLSLVQQAVDTCFNSEDYQEGRMAFMEKRKPEFQGR